MGLDSYLLKTKKNRLRKTVDFTTKSVEGNQVWYWRKYYPIHEYMNSLYLSKGGKKEDFNVCHLKVTKKDLNDILSQIDEDFWYEEKDYRDRFNRGQENLEWLKQALEEIKTHDLYFYSWC